MAFDTVAGLTCDCLGRSLGLGAVGKLVRELLNILTHLRLKPEGQIGKQLVVYPASPFPLTFFVLGLF